MVGGFVLSLTPSASSCDSITPSPHAPYTLENAGEQAACRKMVDSMIALNGLTCTPAVIAPSYQCLGTATFPYGSSFKLCSICPISTLSVRGMRFSPATLPTGELPVSFNVLGYNMDASALSGDRWKLVSGACDTDNVPAAGTVIDDRVYTSPNAPVTGLASAVVSFRGRAISS